MVLERLTPMYLFAPASTAAEFDTTPAAVRVPPLAAATQFPFQPEPPFNGVAKVSPVL